MAGDSALQQAKAEMGRVEDNLVRLDEHRRKYDGPDDTK
jgi:hypothetical protein